jgi:hypothetical protein
MTTTTPAGRAAPRRIWPGPTMTACGTAGSPGELAARAGVSKHALAGRLRRLIRAGGQS